MERWTSIEISGGKGEVSYRAKAREAMPPATWRSRRLAMRADAGNLDHRRLGREARRARRSLDGVGDRGRGGLADRAAFLTDQEHHRIAAVVIVHAGDESVAAFDAVGEPLLAQ